MTLASLRLIVVSLFLYLCSSFFPVAHAQSGPAIQSISPDAVPAGGPDTFITVKGSGFNPSSVITIDNQFLSLPTTFIDEGTLQAVIPYRSTASPGPLFISIKNADTSASTLGPFPFIVFSREPPVVSSVDVSGAPPGATFRMTLSGSHLALAQISFSGSGITVVSSSASETRAWVDVSVAADAPFGPQTMTITTRAGSTSTCGQQLCSFTVLADVGSWMPTGPFHDTRSRAAIVRLLDGRVLIAGGGSNDARQATASAEIFDPATLQWTPTLPMSVARLNASATLLPDGRVLVAGGSDGSQALSSVEIFDPVSLSWSAAGSMTSNYPAKAFLLSDGRVFLFHPVDVNGTRPGELFDPVRGTFEPLPATTAATPVAKAAAVLLSSGKVLLVRISARPAVYDPATNTYSAAHTDCGGLLGTWLRLLPSARE